MSCHKCKSDPCGCADHGLTTPCSYTDCTEPTAETCEELHCMECVTYCGNTFNAYDTGGAILFSINNGERLDLILQKLVLMHYTPACVVPTGDHAVFHLFSTGKTAASVTLAWTGVADGFTTGFNIYYRQYLNGIPLGDFASSLDAGTLVAGTGYSTANSVPTTGGTGTGLTVNIVAVAGNITTVTLLNAGSGYTLGDTITIAQVGSGLDATIDIDGLAQWIQASPPGWPPPPPTPPPLPASTTTYAVTDLQSNSQYGFYIEAIGAVKDCDSVEIIDSTLP